MEAIARKRFIRQSPYKIRFVLKTVKGMNVNDAINKLSLTNKKASIYIEEVLKASISNMMNNNNVENSDNLFSYSSNLFCFKSSYCSIFLPYALSSSLI